MRRVWPALLAFLGVACITAAIAVPAFLVPQLRVVPLDLDITSDSSSAPPEGSSGERFPAVIFDRCSVSQAKARTLDANLSQQRRTLIVDPSDSRQATVQSGQMVRVDRTRAADGKETVPTLGPVTGELPCDDAMLSADIDHVSVNRKTAVPNGTVSFIQVQPAPKGVSVKDVSVQLPDRKGFQYKFGFNVKKRPYLYYDIYTRQNLPANYVGEKTIDGVKTYAFVNEVPETDLSGLPDPQGDAALGTMLTMPAKWWGISGPGVKPNDQITMHQYAKLTRRLWVEPQTGTIVDASEVQDWVFKSPDQSSEVPQAVRDFRMSVLKADMQWSDRSVAYQANKSKGYIKQLRLGGFWLPLILGIVGAVLLVAWGLLMWRGRGTKADDGTVPPDGDDTDTRVIDTDQTAEPTTVLPRHAGAAGAGAAAAAGTAGATEVIDRDEDERPSDEHRDGDQQDGEQQDGDQQDEGYLWDRDTQQIPRVTGPAAYDQSSPASDEFAPVEPSQEPSLRDRRPRDS
ncbi:MULTISPECIES: DUF3068 domain-containing protein [unclassified Gordonia (in: high G+C Gram-positive bacteria)]